MRLVVLFVALALSVSCGKDGGNKSSLTEANGICSENDRSAGCLIQGADGLGVDLLEAMIDVPVKIQDTQVTFLADRSSVSTGRRINCKTAVRNGEVYQVTLSGDRLLVVSSDGSYEFDRFNNSTGIDGTWVWKGYGDDGTHMIRQMSFLSNNRVIIRANCEL